MCSQVCEQPLAIYATLEVIKEVCHHNQHIYHRTVSPLPAPIRVHRNATIV